MTKKNHIGFIETLRALAATAVMLFHFTCFNNGKGDIYWNEGVKSIATYGAQGVEMFYIISGFVITYALTRTNYKIVHYGKYVLKRVIRIIPVYAMTIFSIFFVEFVLSTFFWDYKMQVDYGNIFANITFTVDLWQGTTWINPIFSTLGVEFQFYLLIGVLLPLFNYKKALKYIILGLLIVIGLLTTEHQSVFVNAPYFAIGIMLHDIYINKENLFSRIFLSFIFIVLARFYAIEDVVVCGLTMLLFLFVKPSFKLSNKIGEISYSLYLTHGLFGGWLLFFLSRDEYINLSPYLIIPLAIAFSLIGAKVFYILFEKPSIKLGKRIRFYKK